MKIAEVKRKSVTAEILKALVPYSEQNLKLAFKPGLFFRDLEHLTQANRNTLAATMSRAKRVGWVIERNGVPILSKTGRAKIQEVSKADLLQGWLLLTYDIPETRRADRDRLASDLKRLNFKRLQKSTWYTNEDYVDALKELITNLKIGQHVCLFLAAHVYAPDIENTAT